jgi:tetratricopeptide (TPR) repeat protein
MTGRRLADSDERAAFPFCNWRSPDGRFLASYAGDGVRVYDLEAPPEELVYRRALTQPDPGWHDRQAEHYQKRRRWDAAMFHANVAIASRPQESRFYLRRGNTYAELAQWDKASADFVRALELQPDSALAGRGLALTYLAVGKVQDYQRECAKLLDRFGNTDDAETAKLVARTCAMRPDAIPDPARLLPLAEKLPAKHSVRGAILCRVGRYKEALPYFDRQNSQYDDDSALGMEMYQALADHGEGHGTKAKKALEAVRNASPPSWDARVEFEQLRKEVEKKLGAEKE